MTVEIGVQHTQAQVNEDQESFLANRVTSSLLHVSEQGGGTVARVDTRRIM